jgi:hypothetical protein
MSQKEKWNGRIEMDSKLLMAMLFVNNKRCPFHLWLFLVTVELGTKTWIEIVFVGRWLILQEEWQTGLDPLYLGSKCFRHVPFCQAFVSREWWCPFGLH